ncbi:NADH:flavin oxidoreductase [Chengkuizengella sediminis]|uniref:NADH:flavin oxidoreductase n=1 Tax=Chengkuizengella sediminis TaxID=1885917 RepID=UPI001389AFFA|nr:NADH:flavin oxidoreductase [Chengkuizengella sediminis]NDI34104.1 NADH:flavin oxidoreductase [Chengkuizengella sediminis]
MNESLFNKGILGKIEVSNRFGVAPMTRTSATDEGLVTDRMENYYSRYAEGKFGFIIVEGTYTDREYSQGYFNQPGITTGEQLNAWKKLVDTVHAKGSKIIVQLMHAGAQAVGNPFIKETIAPSEVKPKNIETTPKEATKQDLLEIKKYFVEAAKRAEVAGFDGVEIHGANGYLLDEFLLDYANLRTDEYGGDTQKRVKYLTEIIEAVRESVANDFTVGIRISQNNLMDQFSHQWANGEKDAEVIFSSLKEAGADFIHTTAYDAWKPAFGENTLSLAAAAKKFGNLTVVANGNMQEIDQAEEMIQKGEADFITIGKMALANPDLPLKVKRNEELIPFDPEKFMVVTEQNAMPDMTIKDHEVNMMK